MKITRPTKQQLKKYSLKSIPVGIYLVGYVVWMFGNVVYLKPHHPWWITVLPSFSFSLALAPMIFHWYLGTYIDGHKKGFGEGYKIMEEQYNNLVNHINTQRNKAQRSVATPGIPFPTSNKALNPKALNPKALKHMIKELEKAAKVAAYEAEKKKGEELLKRFLHR